MKAKDQKYKLIRVAKREVHRANYFSKFYQLQALRDIPEHGVKAGDLGGYVSSRYILSHKGSCWVGEEGQVVGGRVRIFDDAYIGGQALVHCYSDFVLNVREQARVTENATVSASLGKNGRNYNHSKEGEFSKNISGNAQIYGNAIVDGVNLITDNAKIYGNAYIDFASKIDYNAEIFGKARIGKRSTISVGSKVFGSSIIGENCRVNFASISGEANIPDGSFISGGMLQTKNQKVAIDGVSPSGSDNSIEGIPAGKDMKALASGIKENTQRIDHRAITAERLHMSGPLVNTGMIDMSSLSGSQESGSAVKDLPSRETLISLETKDALNLLDEVRSELAAYETDIVKIIKYPVMTDKTNPYTLQMTQALKLANRLSLNPFHRGFVA
ncbi:MAG TPA: hypothetical protein VLR52_03745, partial [Bacteroidales bacterium]|nr:hypothetical protein [Bacteroidales bacterium]